MSPARPRDSRERDSPNRVGCYRMLWALFSVHVHDIGGLLCGRPSAGYSSRFGASMNLRHAGQVKIGP